MEVRSGQKKSGQTEKKYVHMLNSTLCATTRTMSCILESYQTDKGVTVPEVSRPWFGVHHVVDSPVVGGDVVLLFFVVVVSRYPR